MVNREMKLAIGDELQTLFYLIVNATKQAAEETRKVLATMKKTLTAIDGALTAQRTTDGRSRLDKDTDTTIDVSKRQDRQLSMGNKLVQIDGNKKTLTVDDTEYKFISCLEALLMLKHPRPTQFNSNDYKAYKSLVAQTEVKSFPNRAGTARPHATWKWKHMFRKMVIPGKRIAEGESEDTGDADSVESYHCFNRRYW